MREQPSFSQIAELFQLELPREKARAKPRLPRKTVGDDAAESEELGRECLSEGDYESAIRHFRRACEQRGYNNPDTLVDLGGAYEYADQAPQALRQYEKALRIQQDATEPQLGLSDLYKRHGRFRDAIERLQKAIELEPGNAFYKIKLAETLRDMGEPNRALRAAQAAVLAKPDESFYHYWVGDLLIGLGRYEEALESLRAAIELSPGDDFLYQRASVAFWQVGRKQEAIKAIRLASDLDPEKHVYHGLLEMLLRATGMDEEADLEKTRSSRMDRYDLDTLSRVASEMGLSEQAATGND